MKNTNKGITLIALIITVIVLLILAGAAISIVINGGDIFGKATQAKEGWNSKVGEEESAINQNLALLNNSNFNNNVSNEAPADIYYGLATADEVEPNLFLYEIINQTTGKMNQIEDISELGKIADLNGNIRLSENTAEKKKARIIGFNWDYIFRNIDGYVPTTAGEESTQYKYIHSGIEEESYPENWMEYREVFNNYVDKMVIPASIKLDLTGKFDTSGEEYEIISLNFHGNEYFNSWVYHQTWYCDEGENNPNPYINFVVPYGIIEIEDDCFASINVQSINIPNSVNRIGDKAFRFTTISELTIPGSVETIGAFAFDGCSNLEKVIIEPGLKYLGEGSFINCHTLKQFTIPNSIIEITSNNRNRVISSCPAIEKINYIGTQEQFNQIVNKYLLYSNDIWYNQEIEIVYNSKNEEIYPIESYGESYGGSQNEGYNGEGYGGSQNEGYNGESHGDSQNEGYGGN